MLYTKIKMLADYSLKTMKTRQRSNIFKVLQKKNPCDIRILKPQKVSFKN